ncbi:MAG: CPBP family intramembrane glutamic endopeptidase [Trueperaceae bacterium]
MTEPGRRADRARTGWTVLAFAPSLAAGLIGATVWAFAPPDLPGTWPWPAALLVGVLLGLALLAAGAVLERTVPSFAYATARTERAVRALRLSPVAAIALALATSAGEELLFRGVLLDRIGLVGQALAFAVLHPAGRKGWSYPLFAFAAALALGALVVITGRIVPAMVAHTVVNGVGLWTTRRSLPPRDATRPRA